MIMKRNLNIANPLFKIHTKIIQSLVPFDSEKVILYLRKGLSFECKTINLSTEMSFLV